MLFHVVITVRVPPEVSPEVLKDLQHREHERATELQERGKWAHLWRIAGKWANVSVFDVESPAELHEVLESLPLFPYMDVQVSALSPHPGALPAKTTIDTSLLENNKRVVTAFYKKGLLEGEIDTAIALYGGNHYRQHTPFAADGFDGLRVYAQWIATNYPHARGEIVRVWADGNYVLLHCRWTGFFGKNGDAIIDVFKLENGKIVEHWDVIQPIPDSSLNTNSMF